MPRSYAYFAIPFDQVPADPPYRVWFTAFSEVPPPLGGTVTDDAGSTKPPRVPFTIGVTTGALPPGATLLGTGRKNSLAPPPPLPPPTVASSADYKDAMRRWVEAGDGTHRCQYFTLPFARPLPGPPCQLWFATWSTVRPQPIAGWPYPPLAIGVIMTELPDQSVLLASGGGKDPPPPPPELTSADERLSDLGALLGERGA